MALIGVVLVVALAAYWLMQSYRLFRQRWSITRHSKTIYAHPFPLVHALGFKKDEAGFFQQLQGCTTAVEKPKIFRMFVGATPFFVVSGAEEAEGILANTKEIKKSPEYAMLEPWLGQGLLTGTGKAWRARRKLLTPAFHYEILKDFMPIFNEQAKILLGKFGQSKSQPVSVYPLITLCALDIICETAMGRNVNAQNHGSTESLYVKAIYELNDIAHQRQKKPWLWPDFMFNVFGRGRQFQRCLKVIKGFTGRVIRERSEEHVVLENSNDDLNNNMIPIVKGTDGKKTRLAFLDLLLNMQKRGEITHDGIQEEVDTFMFEGHDTTTTGMTWFLQLIACNPEIQKKLQAEVDCLFGTDSRNVTYEDLKNLNYLECCIKETLRLYPSVPLIGRTIVNDIRLDGNTIPQGSRLLIFPYSIHRDPKHWPDPYVFKPERFFLENSAGRHPFAYVPFSAGSRNCIGQRFALMEEKTVLSWLLRYFDFKPARRIDQLNVTAELILRPKQGVWLHVQQRRPLPHET